MSICGIGASLHFEYLVAAGPLPLLFLKMASTAVLILFVTSMSAILMSISLLIYIRKMRFRYKSVLVKMTVLMLGAATVSCFFSCQ